MMPLELIARCPVMSAVDEWPISYPCRSTLLHAYAAGNGKLFSPSFKLSASFPPQYLTVLCIPTYDSRAL